MADQIARPTSEEIDDGWTLAEEPVRAVSGEDEAYEEYAVHPDVSPSPVFSQAYADWQESRLESET